MIEIYFPTGLAVDDRRRFLDSRSFWFGDWQVVKENQWKYVVEGLTMIDGKIIW